MLNDELKVCSICDRPMKKRMKHTGNDAGNEFWVCSRFPECRNVERCNGIKANELIEKSVQAKDQKTSWAATIKTGSQPKRLSSMDQEERPYAKVGLFFGSAVFFAFIVVAGMKVDLKGLVFGEIGKMSTDTGLVDYPKVQQAETTQPFQAPTKTDNVSLPTQPQPEIQRTGAFYTFTDKNGMVSIVNELERVPSRYRSNMKVSTGSNIQTTAVIIRNNQIHVPVTIGYQGRTVSVYLQLDTGATGIVISPAIAQRLGIRREATRQGITTIADGSKVQTYITPADYITVGQKTKRALDLNIIPRVGGEETGLLGMSFLADFPHMIDTKAQVIKWM